MTWLTCRVQDIIAKNGLELSNPVRSNICRGEQAGEIVRHGTREVHKLVDSRCRLLALDYHLGVVQSMATVVCAWQLLFGHVTVITLPITSSTTALTPGCCIRYSKVGQLCSLAGCVAGCG